MKAALIGAGQIARQHLACLKSLPGVELAAICDLSPATAEAAAERYGIGTWFTDHRAMLAQVRPEGDAVEALLQRRAFQRACAELAARTGEVVAGRVGDEGVTFLSAAGGPRLRFAAAERGGGLRPRRYAKYGTHPVW